MSSDQPLPHRFNTPLVLLILCFAISACADIQLASDMNNDTRAEYDEAAKELHKSAEAGDSSARNALGLLYYKGKGVPRDSSQAKHWFEKAAQQGHAGAQVNLGTLYLLGDGAPQSAHMALFWFSRASEQGHALALAKLGRMYERGRGVSRDIIQARMWYELSAAHGEKKAAEARDALANQMTSAQIAEADRLAREWKPKTK